MKNLITIYSILLISFCSLAQEKETTLNEEWQNPNWKQLLSKLDTTQIKSGVLIDKVTSFANLLFFNTEKHNTSSKDHFIQALSELYRAANKTKFIEIEKFKTIIKNNTEKNQVLVGIINTTFEKLNFSETKERTGGVTLKNDSFDPIEGQPSFLSRQLLVASPLSTTLVGTEVDFKFSEELIYNNASSNIKALSINFDNGKAPVEIIKDSKILNFSTVVHYEKEGLKTLQFNVIFEDESKMTTNATMVVAPPVSTADLCTDPLKNKGTYQSTIPFQGYTESFPVLGQIEYETFYSSNNTAKKMNKPLLIVDGFDPGDTRKVQDCDCENDPTCREANSTTTFFGSIFNRDKHDSIEESMSYTETLPSGNLQTNNVLKDLRDLGYDVIIINNPTYQVVNQSNPTQLVFVLFPRPHWETRPNYVTIDGGADYIERNGRTLASFIQNFVKTEQNRAGSTESLVLMGPSMGGQITRYALAYMEKKFAETGETNWKHNARLWVSVDSPHLGATVPVAAQANIWFLGSLLGNQEAMDKYNQKLNAVAAKQMTISQFQNALDTHTSGYAGGGHLNNSPFFDTYYNAINTGGVPGSGGYPVSIPGTFRKIALANGSLSGQKEGFEGQEFLGERGFININPIAALGGPIGGALFTDFFDHLFGSSNNIKIDMIRVNDYFMPAYGTSGTVFKGYGFNSHFSLHLFSCNPCAHFENYSLTAINNDIRGSIDVAPGGFLTHTIRDIKEGIEEGSRANYLKTENTAFKQNHSFMPSFTALGHLQPYQDWSNPLNLPFQ